jgi:ligand-binding sensor domain-containing protein/two-component sensor histidine kinase
MAQVRQAAVIGRTLSFALWLGLCVHAASAQQLPIRRYDLRDGLAHSRVSAIYQDRKGFLWFGTWEGLSRFDGYRFTNYGIGDGLDNAVINAIAEDQAGGLWVATNGGGISRLIDHLPEDRTVKTNRPAAAGRKFESFRVSESSHSNRVNATLFDSDNNLWCATDDGLYRATIDQAGKPNFEQVVPHEPLAAAMTALADSRGRLWFGLSDELLEVVHGQVIKYGAADGVGYAEITSVVEDSSGRLLLANGRGVYEFCEPTGAESRGRWKRFNVVLEPGQSIHRMLFDSSGALWIATGKGLIKYRDGQRVYTTANGLSDDVVYTLIEDRDRNLWLGTWSGGACKLSRDMIVSFTRAEGLPDPHLTTVIEDQQGQIYANTNDRGLVSLVNGRAVVVPGSQAPPFNNVSLRILQDRRGDWWFGTDKGLFRFQGPELKLRRGQRFTDIDGIKDERIHGLYEDPKGRLWISAGVSSLYYCDPVQTGRLVFRRISIDSIRPANPVSWMVSDRSGTLWLAGRFGLLARMNHQEIRRLEPTNGLPEIEPRALFIDSRGWLWVGFRSRGVSMTKEPAAEHVEFANYSTATGLASDYILSITEDDSGRIYLGTLKGLDRLDPLTGEIRHFGAKDGLAGDAISQCMKDRQGNIWVATNTGLSKLDLRAEPAGTREAAVFISRVQVNGEDLAIPETGAVRVSPLDLPASRNDLLIEYVGLSFQGEQEIRYQHKLEGAHANWSQPGELRSVNYGMLSPGTYRFLVRAITREGIESPEPAVFEFRVLPPVWQRWWFISLMTLFIGAVIYALYRYRLRRLLEIERVRTRIASDLHDDIGSNLSLIAGLSEMLGQQARAVDSRMAERLSQIATVSRRSVDAMSDIVWAVNPKRDRLMDLSQRMRRFASDSFTARAIQFHFDAPTSQQNVKVGTEVRREVFLIFKEGVNNIVKHSGCRSVEVALHINRGVIVLKLIDDGQGFDEARSDGGQGLASMRRRAEKLGGELMVISRAGAGTSIIMKAPHGRRMLKGSLS